MSKGSQTSYAGRHAELYDLFYADKPYPEEAAFVHRCVQAFNSGAKTMLELACGTGTHSLLLEKYGYRIIATDYSVDMLRRAEEKAKKVNSRVEFRRQDMRALKVPEGPFDVIICLFDSLGYVASNEGLLQVLEGVNRHLAVGGVFLFEFWHGGAMLRSYDPLRFRRFHGSSGDIERISETTVDYHQQVCHVSYTINELNSDGTYHSLHETQVNRFFLLQEMNLFLQQANLLPLKWYSGYSDDEHVNAETWHIVAVAGKGNPAE